MPRRHVTTITYGNYIKYNKNAYLFDFILKIQNKNLLSNFELASQEHRFSAIKVGDRGRSGKDNRLFLEAVLWIVRTGSPWRGLPEHFGKWAPLITLVSSDVPAAAHRNL